LVFRFRYKRRSTKKHLSIIAVFFTTVSMSATKQNENRSPHSAAPSYKEQETASGMHSYKATMPPVKGSVDAVETTMNIPRRLDAEPKP